MNKGSMLRRFALLLSLVAVLALGISGTVAYIAAKTPALTNSFIYDEADFPVEPTPTPTPTPTPEPTPTPTPVPTPTPPTRIDLPDTGDHSEIALWLALMAMSTGGICLMRRRYAGAR